MGIEWTEDLSVGVDEIDGQHQELFDKINVLYEAMDQGKGAEEMANVIKFLEEYVLFHFEIEEKHMIHYGYDGFMTHKKEHDDFVSDFMRLKEEFNAKGGNLNLLIQVQSRVGDWIINHICNIDKALGKFLKAHM